ncbi:DUF1616 domain-containing protein [Thermoproteus tenax]|uniref:DUF1616 domain-containing protein n=1 Tax=Thermoproteus tenax (strain ATCC 35583 / DSM 2078 / JCM 9277 / NBRC 100435 / Kra 1) TaxID=768679 RepID=G4RKA7_THETK|nr:DUF1616 domain-containing protein [Thermoproteus tenax]CCC82002.1 hypothetical protein TTX_1367 [Thermoproteus tenax Kra 1]
MGRAYLLALVLMLIVTPAFAMSLESYLEAYRYIVELSKLGYNVTNMVDALNRALYLQETGHGINASSLLESLLQEARTELPQARAHYLIDMAINIVALALAVAAAALLYLKRRELIGALWLRLRGNDRVRGGGDGRARSLLFDAEVAAVLLAVFVVAVIMAVSPVVLNKYNQPFSAIGLLGPDMKIGGYPTAAALHQPIKLYVYVYNHMGVPTWYVVKLYFVNTTSLPPLNVTPIAVYQRILPYNESWVIPIVVVPNSTGRYRLVGELWMYSPDNMTLIYTGDYVQIWINVTKPTPNKR